MSSLPPTPLCPRRAGGERNGNPMPLGRSLPVPRSALPTKAADHVSPPRRRPGMGTHVAPATSSSRGWVRTRRCAPGGRRAAPPAVPPPGPCLAHSQSQPLQRPGSGARGSSGNWLGGLKRNRASNSYSSYLPERNGERGDTRFPLPSSSRLFPWEAEKTALGGRRAGEGAVPPSNSRLRSLSSPPPSRTFAAPRALECPRVLSLARHGDPEPSGPLGLACVLLPESGVGPLGGGPSCRCWRREG